MRAVSRVLVDSCARARARARAISMLSDIIRVLVAKIVASLVKFAAISIFEMEFRSSWICSPLIEFNESLILMNSARSLLKLTDKKQTALLC